VSPAVHIPAAPCGPCGTKETFGTVRHLVLGSVMVVLPSEIVGSHHGHWQDVLARPVASVLMKKKC
jgi:hypothetical protein